MYMYTHTYMCIHIYRERDIAIHIICLTSWYSMWDLTIISPTMISEEKEAEVSFKQTLPEGWISSFFWKFKLFVLDFYLVKLQWNPHMNIIDVQCTDVTIISTTCVSKFTKRQWFDCVSNENMKCRLLKWLSDHPINHGCACVHSCCYGNCCC